MILGNFLNPDMLWAIPVVGVFLLILLTRSFVKLPLTQVEQRRQRHTRVWIFVSRLVIASLIIMALAQPYTEEVKETKGNPRVTVLVDQSASTQLLETDFVQDLIDRLERKVPTTVRTIGTNYTSDIGSALLRNLDPGGSILLITDGNVNEGPVLADVGFYAATVNSTINAVNLTAALDDAAVVIKGPGKVVAESDATFIVEVSTTKNKKVPLQVLVDGIKALDRQVDAGTISFSRQFSTGTHKLEARIATLDEHSENNVYYKSIHVLPKPKVLLVTRKNSPVELVLRELYTVDKKTSLPQNLDSYYAVIINDAPVENLRNTQELHDFLIDEKGEYYGGGLVLFGGLDSFDRGGYSSTSLEAILPVKVGKGERKKGGANLVFIIDATGTVSRIKYRQEGGKLVRYEEDISKLDVIKAQGVKAIEQLNLDNKLGVVVFGAQMSTESSSISDRISSTVRRLAPIDFLYNNRKDVLDKIPKIVGGGVTAPDVAMRGAVEMLRSVAGDKNIILLTDGRYSAGIGADSEPKRKLLTMASNAHRLYGINFMTIGVGTSNDAEFDLKVDEAFLKELAKAGDGTYDRATKLSSLLIKWGDPKAKDFGQEFALVPLSLTHFITRDVEPVAILNAYNEVVPKDTAELLMAADSGQPALTTWRYGNGRVAAWTVFAGNNLGQLLNDQNSLLLSRTVNWAIGDPQRKESSFVDIADVRTNKEGRIIVKSKTPVTHEGLVFTKEGDVYVASFSPGNPGFSSLLGQTYAANRPSELDVVGMNPLLGGIVDATGGKIFKPSESDALVEHVKESSRRVTVAKRSAALPFLIGAMLILLLEILLRRLTQRR